MNNSTRNIIACGRPGVGKSALGNSLLYGVPQYQYGFESYSDPTKWGVTRQIIKRTKYIEKFKTSIQYIDIPGSGDHTLDMNQFAQSLLNQLKNITINAILYLVSVQDERFTAQELCSIQFIKNFFKQRGLSSQDNLWLIITHCDQKKPSNLFIQSKLDCLKKWEIFIPRNNVIQYNYNLFECNPFIERVLQVPQNQGFTLNQDRQNSLNKFYEGCRVARDVNLDKLKNVDEKRVDQIYQQTLMSLYQELEEQIFRQEQLSDQIQEHSMIIEALEDVEENTQILQEQNITSKLLTSLDILSQNISDYSNASQQILSSITLSNNTLQAQNKQIGQLNEQISDLSQQVNLTNIANQNLQQNIQSENKLLDSLSTQILQEQSQTTSLQNQLNSLQQLYNNFNNQTKIEQDSISQLQSQLNSLLSTTQNQTIANQQISSSIIIFNNTIQALNTQIGQFNQQLNFLQQQVNLTTVAYQNLQYNIQSESTLINSLSNQIQQEQNQATLLQNQLNILENQLQNNNFNQTISQLQLNLSNLNSSIQQVNQSIPVIQLFKLQTKLWETLFVPPQPESIIVPELSKILNIKTTSIARLSLEGHYNTCGNQIFISFAVNGIAISPFCNQTSYNYYMGGSLANYSPWTQISFQQKVYLQPGINNIQLIAQLISTGGCQTLSLRGALIEIETETLPQSN
ncbi:hypothetical protein ABPG73_005669 [Tetrahymena malaccensis]